MTHRDSPEKACGVLLMIEKYRPTGRDRIEKQTENTHQSAVGGNGMGWGKFLNTNSYMSRACCQVVASIWPIRAARYQGIIRR